MSQLITKNELTALLEESIGYGIFAPDPAYIGLAPEDLAQKVFEGEIPLDIAMLRQETEKAREALAKEALEKERRGGLTRDELADKIMQGIVNGALGICYSEIAPYSHGYEVTFGSTDRPGSTRSFTNRWECYTGDLFDVPYRVADSISAGRQSHETFGSRCGPLDLQAMLRHIDDMEHHTINSFTPELETDFIRATSPHHYPYRSSVATVMDVHAGKGLDGIIQHHYHGDYSTITPAKQNTLVETLVCLKGFCLDCLSGLDASGDVIKKVKDYLKVHGTDISTPEKLEQWIRDNPEKCGLEKNRTRRASLAEKIQSASNRSSRTYTGDTLEKKPPAR